MKDETATNARTPNAWIILSGDEKDDEGCPLAWSNADGWVEMESATVFSNNEKLRLNLPIGGSWTPYQSNNLEGMEV